MLNLFFKYFARALMLLLVLPITNSAKGIVAKKLGDNSAEVEGRITLNPMAHLDMLGSLCIMLVGFGWSKPLPINFSRMKNIRKGVVLISLTGPATHYLSAIVCKIISFFILRYSDSSGGGITVAFCLVLIFTLLSNINICLGTIHLLPLPPADGFNLIQQFAGAKFNKWYYSNYRMINQVSFYIIMFLFFVGPLTNYYFDPLGWLITLVDHLLSLTLIWLPIVFK